MKIVSGLLLLAALVAWDSSNGVAPKALNHPTTVAMSRYILISGRKPTPPEPGCFVSDTHPGYWECP
jgi:hypothetical protein